MKKIFIFFLALFLSFSFLTFAKPIEKAYVDGPTFRPPTKAELKQIKCTRDPEFINTSECKIFHQQKKDKGVFEAFIDWILSWFK